MGGGGLTYDGRGNLTAVGGSSYAYDVQNRLTSGPGASFLYDPLERLDTVVTPSTQTRFVYSGSQLIAELDGGNNILRRYVPGVQEDRPLIWYEGTTDYRYRRPLLQDERGSVVASSNDYGSHWENSYDEYGVPASGNIGRFQYTGQLWIPEVALYYYKARFYAPHLGRFLQTDPSGYKDGMNWYAYVGNDPTNSVDPTGEACVVANGWSDYCRRADLYRRLDGALGDRTRFYGAASLTTTMLADLSLPIGSQLAVSGSTRRFMSGMSGALEAMNRDSARRIENGSLSGPGLNARMVHMEQTAVQSHLDGFRKSDPTAYGKMVGEVNALLNPTGATAAAASMYGSDRAYQSVLSGVRDSLGRNIDFANQSDREMIGNALINGLGGNRGCLRAIDQGGC